MLKITESSNDNLRLVAAADLGVRESRPSDYVKPVLTRLGSISDLTKGNMGSSYDAVQDHQY